MRHQATQDLYAYWDEVRAGRQAPRRLDIKPSHIGGMLLDTFILEPTEKVPYAFRLAGTRASQRLGSAAGDSFLDCWSEGDRAFLDTHLAAITDLARVGVFTGEIGSAGTWIPFELLVLPLMHTGQAVDRLLCQFAVFDAEAEVLPVKAPGGLRILAAEAIWPAGRTRTSYAPTGEAPPILNPLVRKARIVRQGRRQFRVYDGGLDGRDPQ